jgi:hypothetical protein
MGLKIKRAGSEEYGRFVKALIAGDPGAGKTRISSTFPHAFYANADAGMMSVADRAVPFVDVTSSEDLTLLLNGLRQPPKMRQQILGVPVQTIVIDTLDAVQKILIDERKRSEKKDSMSIADWGWLGDQMRTYVKNFRNLEMNVIFTVHLKTESDAETGQTFIRPALQGAMGDEIPSHVDVCAILKSSTVSVVENGKTFKRTTRTLQTAGDSRASWLKDRSGKLPLDFEVNLVDDGIRLLNTIFGGETAAPSVVVGESGSVPEAPPAVEKAPAEEPKRDLKLVAAADVGPDVKVVEPESPSQSEGQPEPEAQPEASEPPAAPQPESSTPVEADTPAEPEQPAAETPEAAPEAAPASNDTAIDPSMICESCGDPIETEDQRDLALIRFRKPLDRKCFVEAKKAKK